ncbi:MAG: LiaI-LiaF-like domain-containing protein [Candidatus Aminicenantales bacterium]
MAAKKHRGNLVWGIILVILGLVFLLENLGYDIWEYVGKLWPVILIIWGISKLQASFGAWAGKTPEASREEKKDTP